MRLEGVGKYPQEVGEGGGQAGGVLPLTEPARATWSTIAGFVLPSGSTHKDRQRCTYQRDRWPPHVAEGLAIACATGRTQAEWEGIMDMTAST
jgi:hypothetical protein